MKKKIIIISKLKKKFLVIQIRQIFLRGLTPTYYVPPVISSEKSWILDLIDAA